MEREAHLGEELGSKSRILPSHTGPDSALPESPTLRRSDRIAAHMRSLPAASEPFADSYFNRMVEILKADNLNPFVRAQVFVRKGPGVTAGLDEAVAVIQRYSGIVESGGCIYALEDGERYDSKETQLVIEAPLQAIGALETMYLGVISRGVTAANDGIRHVDRDLVRSRTEDIVRAAGGRPVTYFGARHWHYSEDAAIALAAFEGGAVAASTDAGAAAFQERGVGTIPHALENAYAWRFGSDRAVVESVLAFDRVIDPSVPRIALIDYRNREIADSLACAEALGERLFAVRVDTCGENIAEGALTSGNSLLAARWRSHGIPLPTDESPEAKYWYGHGVTVTGVYALRQALDRAGHQHVRIILTSGFGNSDKVHAFADAEKRLGVRLFNGLGVGGLYPARAATMDVVGIHDGTTWQPLSKTGRSWSPNPRLKLVAGTPLA